MSEPVAPLLRNWWAHDTDARYGERVEAAWAVARHRVLERQALRPSPPTPAGLRALVAVELEEAGGGVAAMRSQRWLDKIDVLAGMLRPGDRVADCGCGLGTEAIAFALAGAEVIAVDLHPANVRIVELRARLYSEAFGVDLAGRMTPVAAHLPRYDPACALDYIWSNESIEHIVPRDVFLRRAPSWLAPGGAVVVWNDNARNPVRLIHTVVQRRGLRAPVFERHDPVDGSPVAMAEEAITTATKVARLLVEGGCSSVEVHYANVVPSLLVRSPRLRCVAGRVEGFSRVPGVRAVVGGDYCVIGRTATA